MAGELRYKYLQYILQYLMQESTGMYRLCVFIIIYSSQSNQRTEHVVEGLRSRQLIAGAVAHGPCTDNESCHGKAVKTSKTSGGCGGRQRRAFQSRYPEFLIIRDCSTIG